jgi:hypothetical protein
MNSNNVESIPFWLVSSFEYEYIDERDGDVSFKIFTKWWWHSKEKLETKINDDGGALFVEESKSECFPVNPSLPFLNLILIENIGQLAKAESKEVLQSDGDDGDNVDNVNNVDNVDNVDDGDNGDNGDNVDNGDNGDNGDKKFLNFAQKVYRAKLRSKLEMKRYPFDRHIVPAIVAVRQWRTNGIKHKWKLLRERPEDEWFGGDGGYPEDKHTVSLIDTWTDQWDELKKFHEPEVRILKQGKGKPVLCLKLERDPSSFFLNVAFPTFITVSIVIMSCYSSGGPSIESVATGVLTLVASQLALQEKLPKKVYITYAGIYLLSAYTFLFGLGIALTIIESHDVNIMEDSGAFWIILVFAVIWGALHLFILLDDRIGPQYFREMFRAPWDKIIIPAEPNFKKGKLIHREIF